VGLLVASIVAEVFTLVALAAVETLEDCAVPLLDADVLGNS
jgi:hypothetical protein